MLDEGWVYVIVNKAMPGLVKVGYTTRKPQIRAAALGGTGTPHPFVVEYEALVSSPRIVEKEVHAALAHLREGKEWFRCSPDDAKAAIKQVVGNRILSESGRAEREQAEKERRQKQAEEFIADQNAVEEINRQTEEINARLVSVGKDKDAINKKRQEQLEALMPASPIDGFGGIYWASVAFFAVLFFMEEGNLISAIFMALITSVPVCVVATIVLTLVTSSYHQQKQDAAKNTAEYRAIERKREEELAPLYNEEKRMQANLGELSEKKKAILSKRRL